MQMRAAHDETPMANWNDALAGVLAADSDALDIQADSRIEIHCPACGAQSSAEFDIAAFFWQEITAQARRLLREVHALARAYGWREADILAMSARRRQAYLSLIGSN
jgi:hypothetical protein